MYYPLPIAYIVCTHGIWTPYPWHIDPPTHGISSPNPLYFDPPAHVISIPLPMVYQTLSYGIMNSSPLVEMRGGSKYNDKKLTPESKYHMENWTRGQNIIWKLKKTCVHYVNNVSNCFILLPSNVDISLATLHAIQSNFNSINKQTFDLMYTESCVTHMYFKSLWWITTEIVPYRYIFI